VTEDASDRSGGSPLPVLGAVAVGVVAVAVALLWPQPRPSLSQPSAGWYSSVSRVEHARSGTGYRVVTAPICVTHGSVTIRSVEPHNPVGSVHVFDWAVSTAVKDPPERGGDGSAGRTRALPGYANRAITASCDTPQFLAIAVNRSSAVAVAQGFDVSSTNGTVLVDYTVKLCAATCP
jgi:hypothetical protein